jgi:hypothetical protein
MPKMTLTFIALLAMAACGFAANVAGPSDMGSRRISPQSAPSKTIEQPADTVTTKLPNGKTVTEPKTERYTPPAAVRFWYYNHGNGYWGRQRDPDGDCVFCSFGMHGVRCNNLHAALLDFESEDGKANRGACGPARLAEICRQRHIPIFNVTGRSIEETYAWAKWAAETGRGAAIAFGKNHFQFMADYDAAKERWYVCDNNSPWRVDEYTDDEFKAKHTECCFWIVVLDGPAPPPPIRYVIAAKAHAIPWFSFRWLGY